MQDSPSDSGDSLMQAFEAAEKTINETSTQKESETQISESEPDESPKSDNQKETVSESKEQKEDVESDKESFSNISPDELPDELKAVYKSLQADYTRKRQQESQRVKELEKQIENLSKQDTQNSNQEQPKPKTAEEYIRSEVERTLETKKIADFRESAIDYYESADNRLNPKSEDYDQHTDHVIGQMMDTKLEDHIKEFGTELGFDYKQALKNSVSDWDQYITNKQKTYFEKKQESLKNKASQSQKRNPRGTPAKTKNDKPTLDEAIELAFQSI